MEEKKLDIPTPGVEPGPAGWEPAILTVRPRGMYVLIPGARFSFIFFLKNQLSPILE